MQRTCSIAADLKLGQNIENISAEYLLINLNINLQH